ncbi:MAG: Fur family transcriptional regulator [Thermaerobacter sp.]|jgi:Fur family ferric uptake transcriptional regulator|nr:Fur family transcriptional regulator [Thermaerobacter sp.]MDA8146547.1 Fur family transcriptional regulator [Thermaerobacter sp.]
MLQEIYDRLQGQDYKLTPQRQIILRAFLDHAGQHLSAEDVYRLVKTQYPEIGLATVYRTLELLSGLDVLHKINFGDGCTRYEVSEGDLHQHHHHHLICVKCGQVSGFADDLLDSLEASIEGTTGFRVLDHQLKFYGICAQCRRESGEVGRRGS